MWSHMLQLPQFSHNYLKLPVVTLAQPKIGVMWSIFQNYLQLPKVPLVQPKILCKSDKVTSDIVTIWL